MEWSCQLHSLAKHRTLYNFLFSKYQYIIVGISFLRFFLLILEYKYEILCVFLRMLNLPVLYKIKLLLSTLSTDTWTITQHCIPRSCKLCDDNK